MHYLYTFYAETDEGDVVTSLAMKDNLDGKINTIGTREGLFKHFNCLVVNLMEPEVVVGELEKFLTIDYLRKTAAYLADISQNGMKEDEEWSAGEIKSFLNHFGGSQMEPASDGSGFFVEVDYPNGPQYDKYGNAVKVENDVPPEQQSHSGNGNLFSNSNSNQSHSEQNGNLLLFSNGNGDQGRSEKGNKGNPNLYSNSNSNLFSGGSGRPRQGYGRDTRERERDRRWGGR